MSNAGLLVDKRITYVREKWGRFERELIGLNSLETLTEPGECSGPK